MKTLLTIGCLCLVAAMVQAKMTEEVLEILKEHIDPCVEEQHISPEQKEKFDEIDLEGEDKTKVGCLKACVLKRLNLIKDNQINPEVFEEVLQKFNTKMPEKIPTQLEIMHKCHDEVKEKTEECEIAFEFSRCFMVNNTD